MAAPTTPGRAASKRASNRRSPNPNRHSTATSASLGAVPNNDVTRNDVITESEQQMSGSTDEPNPLRAESRMSRIAKRAHEIYEAYGGQDGKAIEHWLQAESEIDGEP
jgi:hypothetical protein